MQKFGDFKEFTENQFQMHNKIDSLFSYKSFIEGNQITQRNFKAYHLNNYEK